MTRAAVSLSNVSAGRAPRLTVVTPTFRRPAEVSKLLDNLGRQTFRDLELVLVDGAEDADVRTQEVVAARLLALSFPCRYERYGGGTAIQRNRGVELARGRLVAFMDDDIEPETEFFRALVRVFDEDARGEIGGAVGYRTNEHFRLEDRERWLWYRRLGLLKVFEPGRYDFESGYPINANMQPPFVGTRSVDFMTTACAMWRREVLDEVRFDPFFRDYGVLEDAHFSLRAGRRWRLVQCGDARCVHAHSPHGRANRRRLGYKYVVNYYYVFKDVAGPLSPEQKLRFFRFQGFELLRTAASGARRRRPEDFEDVLGRLEGLVACALSAAPGAGP
ncbi:MAG: glycosyltransferase family 2 protein [Deltaproteobacteria bacterium]|nr:glycosyltransferase family 2 protein [Deltaproteobacteria bacterium]